MPGKTRSGKKTGRKSGGGKKRVPWFSNLVFFSSLALLGLCLLWLAFAYLPLEKYLPGSRVNPIPARPAKKPGLPAAPEPAAALARQGQKLLLQTRQELDRNQSLFQTPPTFSDCSVDEHYLNCLEITLGSDQEAIVAELFIRDLWQRQAVKIGPGQKKQGSNSMLVALNGDRRMAEIVLRAPQNPAAPSPQSPAKPRAWKKVPVAIVIDDLGEDYATAEELAKIPGPITWAILPFRAKSSETLDLARQAGKPALLHMPMEPLDSAGKDPGPDALLLSLSEAQVRETLDRALESLPGVIGVNNHMGSAFTSRPELMAPVLEELKSRGLFFLDSRTTNQSVGMTLAREMGVRTCARKIFLDNLEEPSAIEQKLMELCRAAQTDGFAIAIGHPYPETLRVLRDQLPALAQNHCQLSPLEELCR